MACGSNFRLQRDPVHVDGIAVDGVLIASRQKLRLDLGVRRGADFQDGVGVSHFISIVQPHGAPALFALSAASGVRQEPEHHGASTSLPLHAVPRILHASVVSASRNHLPRLDRGMLYRHYRPIDLMCAALFSVSLPFVAPNSDPMFAPILLYLFCHGLRSRLAKKPLP